MGNFFVPKYFPKKGKWENLEGKKKQRGKRSKHKEEKLRTHEKEEIKLLNFL